MPGGKIQSSGGTEKDMRTLHTLRIAAKAALLVALCGHATACSTTSADYFARMDAKGHGLIDRQRWEDALKLTRTALSNCDRTDWCAKDARYQASFYTTIGEAEEHLDRRDLAIQNYRKAFYAYPLFFTENYFRLLRDTGQYRLLRREIDVKLASNESAYRSATAVWLNESQACGGKMLAGNYRWSLRPGGGRTRLSGKAVVAQSGCVVSAEIVLPEPNFAGGLLHLRGDAGTRNVSLLFGPPCLSTDRGDISVEKNGFAVKADRAAAAPDCLKGSYVIEFVRD
jgi:tetratricopeptide (TPR) repeat protein